MNILDRTSDPKARRRGTVLLLVLVVVMLLSFSMYSFAEMMLVQYDGTRASLTDLQLRQLADSGIVACKERLIMRRSRAASDTNGSKLGFRDVQITTVGGTPARYSILQFVPAQSQKIKYGFADESALLNLNALPVEQQQRRDSIARLMHIPGMRPETAAAIMDWMDADDEPSDLGAESAWYSAQKPAYRPRQGRLQTLQELLLVRGVTKELLFGEDTNQNGILDPHENDGATRPPNDNADGVLQAGWSELLTIHSAERTLRADGSKKINLNDSNLVALYDALETQFGRDMARFVVALRMKGRTDKADSRRNFGPDDKRRERIASGARRLQQQLGNPGDTGGLQALADSESTLSQNRGGILLSTNGSYEIRSLIDLIGGSVRVDVDRVDTILRSPWADDVASLKRALAELELHLTLTDSQRQIGRINIFQAPYAVLMTIPHMTESLARAIELTRPRNPQSNRLESTPQMVSGESIVWLLERRLLDLKQFRLIAPYITAKGDVVRGVSVGHIDGVRRQVAVRFLLDATDLEPHLLEMQDIPPIPLQVGGHASHARGNQR